MSGDCPETGARPPRAPRRRRRRRAVFLPVLGAASDAIGRQATMLSLVPTCVIGALILASAAKIVDDDIANVRRGSLTRRAVTRLSQGLAARTAPATSRRQP